MDAVAMVLATEREKIARNIANDTNTIEAGSTCQINLFFEIKIAN